MRFLLDTNVVIAMIRLDRRVVKRANAHSPADVFTSSIVLHELFYGALKSARVKDNLAHIENIGLQVLDLTRDDCRRAAELRTSLERRGTPIGPYDTLLAGQALARGLVLVTRNIREFARVEGLAVENWED